MSEVFINLLYLLNIRRLKSFSKEKKKKRKSGSFSKHQIILQCWFDKAMKKMLNVGLKTFNETKLKQ